MAQTTAPSGLNPQDKRPGELRTPLTPGRPNKFLDLPGGPERGAYAEDTDRLIDAEVKRIMTDAHAEAHLILSSHHDMLEDVTRRLLDVEVMEGAELRQILDGQPAASAQDDTVQASPSPGAP